REKLVDPVKIALNAAQWQVLHRLRSGDSQVEIDVGVDSKEEMLKDQVAGTFARFKSQSPAFCRGLAISPLCVSIDEALRKMYVQLLHSRVVLKLSSENPVPGPSGNLSI